LIAEIIEARHFSGPLPPPEVLRQYNDILPGGAERIFTLAENRARHRQNLEQQIINAQIEDARAQRAEARLGQIFAFLIGTIAIATGAWVAIQGAPWTGAFIGGGGVIGLVSVFVYGRRQEQRLPDDLDVPGEDTPSH
jgi:uncharacterized membrane protein